LIVVEGNGLLLILFVVGLLFSVFHDIVESVEKILPHQTTTPLHSKKDNETELNE
jgi:hypothetical protein